MSGRAGPAESGLAKLGWSRYCEEAKQIAASLYPWGCKHRGWANFQRFIAHTPIFFCSLQYWKSVQAAFFTEELASKLTETSMLVALRAHLNLAMKACRSDFPEVGFLHAHHSKG